MTARDRFLAELAEQRARRQRGERVVLTGGPESTCPQCGRARRWLCAMGRPCVRVRRDRRPHRSHAARERCRRYWLRKYGVAA